MHVGPASSFTGSSGFAAMAAGVRSQMHTTVLHEVLGMSGLLTDHLAASLEMLMSESQALAEAGAVTAHSDLTGQFIDLLA